MEGEVKGKTFKMKGHTLPGINQRSEGNTDLPDGRSKSSAFQFGMLPTAAAANLNKSVLGAVGASQRRGGGGGRPGGGGRGSWLQGRAGNVAGAMLSKPSLAKIYNKEKGKRTEY